MFRWTVTPLSDACIVWDTTRTCGAGCPGCAVGGEIGGAPKSPESHRVLKVAIILSNTSGLALVFGAKKSLSLSLDSELASGYNANSSLYDSRMCEAIIAPNRDLSRNSL